MIFIYIWFVNGLLAYIIGLISDSILYKRKIRIEGIDIPIVILSLVLGYITCLLVFISIYKGIKRRKGYKNGK